MPGKGPGACPSSVCPSQETRRRGGVTLFKIHFFVYKCSRGETWAPFLQFVSKGPRHMSTNHVAGVRGGGDSCQGTPGHTLLPAAASALPAEPLCCPLGAARHDLLLPTHIPWPGRGQGSLPISAAQLPAVLILAALRVIHLVDTETLLEVLGPNLRIQDLLSHAAGEPASLLVMQTLAKDPPCVGRGRGGSEALQVAQAGPRPVLCGEQRKGRRRGPAGLSRGPLPSDALLEMPRPG